jgi:Lysyl oxidase
MWRDGKIGSSTAAQISPIRRSSSLTGIGNVTLVGSTARVALAAAATASALTVGVVGVVLAVGDGPSQVSNIPAPSQGGLTTSPVQSTQPTPTSAGTVPATPPLLLPNMRSLSASDLSIEVVGGTRRLRFAASLANVGPGPLFLLPRGRGGCRAGQHHAVQVLHSDRNRDGIFQRARDRAATRRVTGCMLIHPGHDHWHFDAMASYSLRRPGSSQVLVSRPKVSFCLRDNVRVPRQRVVVPRRHFGECTRRSSQQGISPGWVDVYKADLSGQWLRLPASVSSEVLCLDLKADPWGRLVETNEADNATSVAIRIDGRKVRRLSSTACR